MPDKITESQSLETLLSIYWNISGRTVAPTEHYDIYTLTTTKITQVENVTRMDKLELVLGELFCRIAPRSFTSKARWCEQSRQQGLLLYKTDLNKDFDVQIGAIIIYYSSMNLACIQSTSFKFYSDLILPLSFH